MSSTRRSTTGEFHPERFCSAPEFEGDVINGLLAAKRIALLKEKAVREVLWFIQWRSLSQGGLQQLCDELSTAFPDRIGGPKLRNTRRSLARAGRRDLNLREVNALRDQFGFGFLDEIDYKPPEQFKADFWLDLADAEVKDAMQELPERLKRFCLDPQSYISDGVSFFDDLLGALCVLRDRFAAAARSRLAETAMTLQVNEALDFCMSERSMVLIEGVAGIGKSVGASAWAESQCGLVRLVEVPSSSDDRSFYAAVARALGVARGTSMKAQEIKVRVEETLLASRDLLLLGDESQYLWGQYTRPRRTPDRLLWIKSIFDAGTPIALVAHTDFSKWQAHYVKQTLWTDEQFERRLNRRVMLPAEHSREDMLKIARAQFPQGDSRCWSLLAAYALGTEKKQASGIVEALKSARYRAKKAGRDQVTFADIEAALIHDHAFMNKRIESSLQPASTTTAKALKPRRNGRADTQILPRQASRLDRLTATAPT